MNKEEMIEEIKKMTVVELADLVKAIEEEFGVSAVAAAAPVAGAGAAAAEEKSTFNVVLTSAGDQKIKVITAVKNELGLGLKDAKDLVDGAPKTLKENVILGKLIPTGTGLKRYQNIRINTEKRSTVEDEVEENVEETTAE